MLSMHSALGKLIELGPMVGAVVGAIVTAVVGVVVGAVVGEGFNKFGVVSAYVTKIN